MLEDLRIALSEGVVQVLGVELNRYHEQLLFDYSKKKLVRPGMLYFSGSLMRLAPEHIFLTVGYNLFLLTTTLTTFILIAFTALFLSMDFKELIMLGLLVVLQLIGLTSHINYAYKRSDVVEMMKIQMALQGQRVADVSTSAKPLWMFFKKYWAPLMWSSWGIYLVAVPAYRYYVLSDAFSLPFPMWFPFETRNLTGFLLAFFFQILSVNCFCVQAITLLPCFFYITMCITKEFEVLIDSLQSIHHDLVVEFQRQLVIQVNSRSAKSIFYLYRDPGFIACLNKRLQKIVDRHALILKGVDTMQTTIAVPLTVNLGSAAFVLGFALCFLASESEDFSNKVSIAIITVINTFIIAIICFVGQNITDVGEKVRKELYFVNWYDWPEPMKRSLRIMLERTLNPPTLGAAYFDIKANCDTFATILNSAYSLFNLLLAFKK